MRGGQVCRQSVVVEGRTDRRVDEMLWEGGRTSVLSKQKKKTPKAEIYRTAELKRERFLEEGLELLSKMGSK